MFRELAGFFFNEPRNVVPRTPYLWIQDEADVTFTPQHRWPCRLRETSSITTEILDELSLYELIRRVVNRLEARVPTLATQKLDPSRLAEVVRRASEVHEFVDHADR